MDLELIQYQQLLGELKGLEIGSLHMERTEDSGDEELSYIPGSPDEDPLFRWPAGRDEAEAGRRDRGTAGQGADGAYALLLPKELTMKEIGLTLGGGGVAGSQTTRRPWCVCARRWLGCAPIRRHSRRGSRRPAGGGWHDPNSGKSVVGADHFVCVVRICGPCVRWNRLRDSDDPAMNHGNEAFGGPAEGFLLLCTERRAHRCPGQPWRL